MPMNLAYRGAVGLAGSFGGDALPKGTPGCFPATLLRPSPSLV
jgi:hypothetical protein